MPGAEQISGAEQVSFNQQLSANLSQMQVPLETVWGRVKLLRLEGLRNR